MPAPAGAHAAASAIRNSGVMTTRIEKAYRTFRPLID
jgi:hypothetical protein